MKIIKCQMKKGLLAEIYTYIVKTDLARVNGERVNSLKEFTKVVWLFQIIRFH